MNTRHALEALSMDLKRLAAAYRRGSIRMARFFSEESLAYLAQINKKEVKPYINEILLRIPGVLDQKDTEKIAENALMYGALLQNYCVSRSQNQEKTVQRREPKLKSLSSCHPELDSGSIYLSADRQGFVSSTE